MTAAPPPAERVAALGAPGARVDFAARALYPNADVQNIERFADIVRSVEGGRIEIAIAPVESSTAGRVPEVYQMLASMNLYIVGEHFGRLRHVLAAPSGAARKKAKGGAPADRLAALTLVCGAPDALALCRDGVAALAPKAAMVERSSAAEARAAALDAGPTAAALLSPEAAAAAGWTALTEADETPLEEHLRAATRYFLLARAPRTPTSEAEGAITTVLFQVRHTPGALAAALRVFADHALNLAKLETYLVSGNNVEPTFHVDVATARTAPAFVAALEELVEHVAFIKILGSYPASPLRSEIDGFLPV